tara:strand:+ start:159 stop:479 length:321 start_codon:yes stop_codon:yes gene_type:complete
MEGNKMKQYPIWNDVHTPDYSNQFSKSFGCRTASTNNIKIGTSSKNSFDFLKTEIKTIKLDNGTIDYVFYVDNKVVKQANYNPKNKKMKCVEAQIIFDTSKKEYQI